MTFPRNVGQVPIYYNYKSSGRPDPEKDKGVVFWSHYIDEKHTPLYPFGYGLSYSKFEYSNLKLDRTTFSAGGKIAVSVDITNNSKVAGKEVVQWYIRDLVGSFARPVKELKGFDLVELKPFETKTVNFTINEETIQFHTANSNWEAENGEFKVFVGGNSETTIMSDFQYAE